MKAQLSSTDDTVMISGLVHSVNAACDRIACLREVNAELLAACEAQEWAEQYKGAPAGDSKQSREASADAIRRANAELFTKARELRKAAIAKARGGAA